ncbi:molybdenum cofactor sulfurase [Chenopodium quinoa]|uniref:molybdenum cofactor sulfurase n=1 Tax=Chenopodium quinoa TaxID=63459 RepID=UPI000B786126|nr:molybdenum cofactor sulfurase [Chenopodium quinoa]
MQSTSTREVTELCFHGCCPTPFFTLNEADKSTAAKPRNSSAENRRTFASTTSSSLFPNTEFNNPDSLPSLQEAFDQFIRTYPNYTETYQIDEIRAQEYYNLSLSNHVCLDYIGIGLFSFSQLHNQLSLTYPSTSSSPPPLRPHSSDFPVFHLSYKSVNLKNHLLEGGNESRLESAIKKRIREFLNNSEDDYSVVLTANRTSAFRLVAESYPFGSCKKLLTVYDHDSEAVDTMINSSEKRGAQAMAAEFTWPRLRIHSSKLRSMITSKRMISKKRGLFVFQLQSRVTGARYSYQWMKVAQEHGWHILLDACAVGPKDMDSLGLSLFQPDFLICSFYKVFGENPSGFGCLFVKKSAISILETSTTAGIVSIVSARKLFYLPEESSGTETEFEQELELGSSSFNSFSGPISIQAPTMEKGESSTSVRNKDTRVKINGQKISEIEVIDEASDIFVERRSTVISRKRNSLVECRCLDHIDALGLSLVNSRSRYLVNWLINGLTKLQHPNAERAVPLVKIYGPKIKFDRGPALAFNVFDWKGEKVEPILIQKLADRKSISLSYGFLHHIWFPEKYEQQKASVLEKRRCEAKENPGNKKKGKENLGIRVVTAAFGFIATFADAYKLWAFVAQFLDADFVEKERWRYTALNQTAVEI